jgi:hypothetical protein
LCALACLSLAGGGPGGQDARRAEPPTIPKTWDDQALLSTELPLARPDVSPAFVSSDYYYRMPVRPIYKRYPIYRPDREPPEYFNRLAREEPQIVFDERTLTTEQDWIDAGRIVFAAPIEYESSGQLFVGVRDLRWYAMSSDKRERWSSASFPARTVTRASCRTGRRSPERRATGDTGSRAVHRRG